MICDNAQNDVTIRNT